MRAKKTKTVSGARKKSAIPTKKARPYKLDDKLIKRVGVILREAPGAAMEVIAGSLRVHRDSFHDWLRQGEAHIDAGDRTSIFARFYLEFTAAKYDGEIALIKEIRKASPQFILARRCPERWPSERMQMELSGPGGKPLAAPTVQFVFAPTTTVYPPFQYSDESQTVQIPEDASPEQIDEAVAKEIRRRELAQAEANAQAERERRAALASGTVPGRLSQLRNS
jgi:hypothetical protein